MDFKDATRVSTRITRQSGRIRLPCLGLLALLVMCLSAQAGEWQVSGRVSFSDGQPAAYAQVHLSTPDGAQFSTSTDANGNYQLYGSDSSTTGAAIVWAVSGGCTSPTSQLIERDVTKNIVIAGTGSGC